MTRGSSAGAAVATPFLAPFLALFLALFPVPPAQAADGFAGLWRTPDQRGAQLLRDGDAAGAAHRFTDPRWRAYAQLRAGDYPAAAKGFAAFDDADAHYNRGNALAHAGDLKGALAAYDAALARDPGSKDARHNRDLVAKALSRQPPSQGGQGGTGPNKAGGRQGAGGKQGGASGNTGNGAAARPSGGGTDQAHAASGARDGAGAGAGTQAQTGDDKDRAAQDARAAVAAGKAQADDSRAASASASSPASSSASPAGAPSDAAVAPRAAAPSGDADKPPETERQLALEQWLRRIPDDPAGLLRRKFMIEHLMRQRDAQQ